VNVAILFLSLFLLPLSETLLAADIMAESSADVDVPMEDAAVSCLMGRFFV
jgi:hypothetical protein